MATEGTAQHRCYKLDGPEGLLDSWNPNEPHGFYWIDDAFGPNQPREDYIDRWIAMMPKIQAAIAGKNRFVLTSPRHIYEAAKPKLGSRNHPLFRDGRAIVDVGALTDQERRQILYNHIKAGNQPPTWKSRIKPQLETLSREATLLPEIARRLADPAYTKHISTAFDDLLKFIREPREHLLQTIKELSKLHRSALTLVFLHRGYMPVGGASPEMMQLVLTHFAVDAESLGQALLHLRDSFLVQTATSIGSYWNFKHPTIADAIGEMLGQTEGMVELYLRGSKSHSIRREAVCVNAPRVPDAVLVPTSLDELLVERLAELPDEIWLNRTLFAFLSERASDRLFRIFVTHHPTMLSRTAVSWWLLIQDPKILAHARAHSLGLLPDELRMETATRLETTLLNEADASFLENDNILALLQPTRLLKLSARVRGELLEQLPRIATEIGAQVDLATEPSDNFDDLHTALRTISGLFDNDDYANDRLRQAYDAIDTEIIGLEAHKKERDAERANVDDDWDWASVGLELRLAPTNRKPLVRRSTFSDVDE
jgi:hypothetical protein